MKRFLIPLLFLLLLGALPTFAQDNSNLIILNDATPVIDVVISLPPDTTGAVSLEIAQAAITLTDSNNQVVFHAADNRLHAVDLNISPNRGSHTLRIERLPGITEASVQVTSLPELAINGTVNHISGSTVTLNEEVTFSLDASIPGGTANVSIPDGTIGVVTATFPGSTATTQLVDAQGNIVAQSSGGNVDGVNLALDAGNYTFTVLGSGLTRTVAAGVRLVSVQDAGITVLEAPASTETAVVVSEPCTATVTISAANLRSGPGTGYSVIGYAYMNENYAVGGQNPENNWLVVDSSVGPAWIKLNGVGLQGSCDALTVFNTPLRDAQVAPVIITTPLPYSSTGEEHEAGEVEGGEQQEGDDD